MPKQLRIINCPFSIYQLSAGNTRRGEVSQTHLKHLLTAIIPETPSSTSSDAIKTLGLYWNSGEDKIIYKIAENSENSKSQITKHTMLAEIARLFDPLGLLGPIIVYAKMMIQILWKLQLTWDESIPQDLHFAWQEFRDQ